MITLQQIHNDLLVIIVELGLIAGLALAQTLFK